MGGCRGQLAELDAAADELLDCVLCAHYLAEDDAAALSEGDEDALINFVLTGEHDVAEEDAHL